MNSFKKLFYFTLLITILSFFGVEGVGGVKAQMQSQEAQSSNSKFNFYRNLKIGDTGQDVLQLQKILNQDSDTRVAISGSGSVGNETTYFGNLTKTALIKFQNKYRSEILVPVGLIYGTGYFGPSTIDFVENSFYLKDENKAVNIDSVNIPKDVADSNENNLQQDLVRSDLLKLYFVSQKVFETGQELTVVGGNINSDSEIYFFNFDNDKIISSVEIDSNFIMFDAPNIPSGEYELYIKNDNFISNPIVVEIVDDYNPPKISSVSPDVIEYGDTVTINGSNFESQNTVMTALGTYDVDSDGDEIKFIIERPANLNFSSEIADPIEQKIEGVIQIQNSNGISDAEIVDFLYN